MIWEAGRKADQSGTAPHLRGGGGRLGVQPLLTAPSTGSAAPMVILAGFPVTMTTLLRPPPSLDSVNTREETDGGKCQADGQRQSDSREETGRDNSQRQSDSQKETVRDNSQRQSGRDSQRRSQSTVNDRDSQTVEKRQSEKVRDI